MLVLSRKENEKVLFPHLGIALQILRVGGGKVRLGIEAPSDVSVVRHEIASEEQIAEFFERLQQSTKGASHEVRNRLHQALLGMCLVHKQLSRNMIEDAEETLTQLIAEMEGLDSELGQRKPSPTPCTRKALVVEDNSNERRLLAS